MANLLFYCIQITIKILKRNFLDIFFNIIFYLISISFTFSDEKQHLTHEYSLNYFRFVSYSKI